MSHYAIFLLGCVTGSVVTMFTIGALIAISEHMQMKQVKANQKAYRATLKGYEADTAAYMLGGNV